MSARKGVTDYDVEVHGRAAHAGVEPERGRHAVLQAAHLIVALQALNGRWPGVTVNVGVVEGGTRPNVVPERCRLQVDLRSPAARDARGGRARGRGAVRVAPRSRGPRSRCTPPRGTDRWSESERSERLVGLAAGFAAELGFDLRDAATGGASDANTTSAAGTPTLDGLGPIGGDDHAPGEWLDLASVVPRTAMLAALIAVVMTPGTRPLSEEWRFDELHPEAYRTLVEGVPAILYIDRPGRARRRTCTRARWSRSCSASRSRSGWATPTCGTRGCTPTTATR